ncbi:MAG: phosphohistidine phosphatase SixA [Neptuniibacter sp.]
MKFFLMRHGEAETFAKTDRDRKLTDQGKSMVRERITALRAALSDIDCIVHSPFLRTTQTAEIVATILNIDLVTQSPCWVPNANPLEALTSLESYVDACPLLVSHMPLIASVEALCAGEKNYPINFECTDLSEIHTEWPSVGMGAFKRL